MISLAIKHDMKVHELSLPLETSVAELHELLECQTGVFQRHQKLIYKGKVLPRSGTLRAAKLPETAPGSGAVKLMLLVSHSSGAAVQTQGQQAAAAAKKAKQDDATARVAEALAAARRTGSARSGGTGRLPLLSVSSSYPVTSWVQRREAWGKTGVVGLRGLGLEEIPENVFSGLGQEGLGGQGDLEEVEAGRPDGVGDQGRDEEAGLCGGEGPRPMGPAQLEAGTFKALQPFPAADGAGQDVREPRPDDGRQITPTDGSQPTENNDMVPAAASSRPPRRAAILRAADLSQNLLVCLPLSLTGLTGLTSLRLGNNRLEDRGVPWAGIAARLGGLTLLELDHNLLTRIPEEMPLGLLRLQRLSASDNFLAGLPDSLGALSSLQLLAVDGNRICSLPESIGGCVSLVELSACGNTLRMLPDSICQLRHLQMLRLAANCLSSLPPRLLSSCPQLSSLQLEGNIMTLDVLRASEGFEAFDARRRAKCDKQLEGGALFDVNRSFSEGADKELHQPWHQTQWQKRM